MTGNGVDVHVNPRKTGWCGCMVKAVSQEKSYGTCISSVFALFKCTLVYNSQDSRIWYSKNLYLLHDVPTYPKKLGVQRSLSCWHVVDPIFLEQTVYGNVYKDSNITQFISLLQMDEHNCWISHIIHLM